MFGTEGSKRIIIAWILYIQDDSKGFETIQNAILNFEEKMKKFLKTQMFKQVLDIQNHFLKIENWVYQKLGVLEHFGTLIT